MRILVTGFEPFGGGAVNPSAQLVARLVDEPPPAVELRTATLPVSYARARRALAAAVRAADPAAVVCFGQAGGAAGVRVERVALNLDDSDTADNDGVVSAQPIRADGPVAYWSTMPVEKIVDSLRVTGIPACTSRDAGGFLCNHVFYSLLDLAATRRPALVGGFVHVPLLPEQALDPDTPSLPLDTLVKAGRIVLAVVADSLDSGRARGADHAARAAARAR